MTRDLLPVRNVKLLLEIADEIERNPFGYNQEIWLKQEGCNTTGCIAGWGCVKAGYLLVPDTGGFIVVGPNGLEHSVDSMAAEVLGLTDNEASTMFSSTWMRGREDEVPEVLRAIAAGAEIWDDEYDEYDGI